jgi:exosortase/archaeosortase
MSAETFSVIVASVLSLGFSYIPGLNEWFATLESVYKRLYMLALMVIVAGVSYALACTGSGSDVGITLTCDKTGAIALVKLLIFSVMANQSTYQLTPQRRYG